MVDRRAGNVSSRVSDGLSSRNGRSEELTGEPGCVSPRKAASCRRAMGGGNGVRQRRTELRIRRNGEQNAEKRA